VPVQVVRAAERRRTETPNGVMTTSASPGLGCSARLSLWWVEMQEGAAGPAHIFDTEQVWSVVEGSARVDVEGVVADLGAGDTVVLPAGAVRQMTATTRLRVVACSEGTATVSVPGEEASRGTPPWIR